MASKRNVGGSEVRAWAQSDEGQAFLAEFAAKKDLTEVPTVGSRGRFGKDLLAAFHAANRKVRYSVGHVQTVKVTGVRVSESGRKQAVTVAATLPEIRAYAQAEGMQVGARGRLSAEVKAAFAASR